MIKKKGKPVAVAADKISSLGDALQMALQHHQAGRLDDADGIYREILAKVPLQPDALHYSGVVAYQRGFLGEAEQLIRQAIEFSPLPDMYKNLAVVLTAQGRKSEAPALLKCACEMAPDDAGLVFSLAGAQRDAGDWGGSRDTLASLIAQYPTWVEALLNLANAEKNLGNLSAAEGHYLQALKLRPDFAEAHSNLGALYAETDQIERALWHNQRAVELMPEFAPFYYNLGNALLSAGQPLQAIRAHEEALRISPNYLNAMLNLAAAKQLVGDIDGALEINQRVISLEPSKAKAYINMGNLALLLRRHEEALAYLKKGLELEPASFAAWCNAGEVLRELGRLDDARDMFREALSLAPMYGMASLSLAAVEERANRIEDAEAALRNAFNKPVGMGVHSIAADCRAAAHLKLANLYAAHGRKEEALIVFERGLALVGARPGMQLLPSEKKETMPRLVLLHPIGRAGSLFLHSLIDGHPQISTTPGVLLKGFFGENVWAGLCPSFSNPTWREELVDRFCNRFAPLLDASSPLPVPGNPLGEPTFVGRGLGLCEMGGGHDVVLRLDHERFRKELLSLLRRHSGVSAAFFFWLLHQAYDATLGRPTDKPVLFFHIHNPDALELAGCLASEPEVLFLNIVRQPLQAIESWMQSCFSNRHTPEALLLGYQDAVERLDLTIKQASHLAYQRYTSAAVRLEDIKRSPEVSLPVLAAWMGIADHDCLRECTFGGLEYSPPANQPVKGFETSNLERKPGHLFNETDQRVMNILLYPIAVQYGYREADAEWLHNEIAWYKPKIQEPLNFEKMLLEQLAKQGYQKDSSGPRRYFESIAQRCINLLEQFGTYPAMAPWLRADSGGRSA